jgi:hypothetical protein
MDGAFDHEHPPASWDPGSIADALERRDRVFPIPTYDQPATWRNLRSDPLVGAVADAVVTRAQERRGDPIPPLPATHYLRWEREEAVPHSALGEPLHERLRRLSAFALAECFERDGAYLDSVLDYGWAVCEQSQWALHARNLADAGEVEGLPVEHDAAERRLPLRTAMVGKLLAEVDYVLGDQLHPALRQRIRREVDRRVFAPYEERDDLGWMTPEVNNWNAVCNGCTLIAALHLIDDVERQAAVVAKAGHNLGYYLDAFDGDGNTSEGIGYWNYGFGHYTEAAAHLETRTGGAFSLLSPPVVDDIAQYPLAVELSPGRYVPFSDAEEDTDISPYVACWLGRRLGHRGLAARGRRAVVEQRPVGRFGETLRNLAWCVAVPADWSPQAPPRRQFFAGTDWWIARDDPTDPNGLVVAAKGGHNDEPHNHNDCGSFVLHWNGESLLTDPGGAPYQHGYFEDDRYSEYVAPRSLGHSVPHVDGTEQAAGEAFAASVVGRSSSRSRETFELELADCYPAPDLTSLRRTITLDRGDPGRVTVADRPTFAPDAAADFESVLVSYFPMTVADGTLRVDGTYGRAVVVPNGDVTIRTEHLPEAVGTEDLWRARLVPPEGEDPSERRVEFGVDLRGVRESGDH